MRPLRWRVRKWSDGSERSQLQAGKRKDRHHRENEKAAAERRDETAELKYGKI